jgi:uncharacterized membrane protein (UPF0182 family)
LLDDHTIFGGVTYTDAHVTLTGMLVVCAALVLGAVIAAVNAVRVPRGRWLLGAILPAAVCYVAVQGIGWYVSSFIVKPNELVREKPYIVYNTDLTRQAYGLNRVSQREFPAETTVEAADRPTIRQRFKTFGCGTGTPSKTRCVKFRKSALIMTFPILTLIVMRSMARHAR